MYLAGRLLSAALGLMTLFAFTHMLSPEDYGRYSVIIAMAGLISGVGFQWLRQCLVKFATDPRWDRSELLGSIGFLFLGLTLIFLLLATIVAAFRDGWDGGITLSLISVTVVLALAQAWFELGLDAIRVDMNPVRYGAAGVLRAAICLGGGVLAAWLTQSLMSVVLAVALGYLFANLFTAPRWLDSVLLIREASWPRTKRLVTYGLPLALTLGFTFIVDTADRLMLAAIDGVTEAGVYSSAYNLGQYAIGTLLAGMGLAIFPIAVRRYAEQGADRTGILLGHNLILLTGLALPAALGIIILAPTLTRLLLGNFTPGTSPIVTGIIAVGVTLAAVRSYAYDIVFMLEKKTLQQACILAAAAGANVLLNWVFIPRWGAVGAASATVLSFLLALGLSIIFGRRLIKIRFKVLDMVKIVIGGGVMGVTIIAIPVVHSWLWLALSVMLGIVVYSCVLLILNPLDIRAKIYGRAGKIIL
jgi:O-antigen/teichoic acid export membrane protein